MRYSAFSNFIYRVPVLPLNYEDPESFKSDLIQEAIYLASPDLYESLNKTTCSKTADLPDKIRFSFNKYLSRMKSRCTPFGLFAGIGVGEITSSSNIELDNTNSFGSVTRLDMNYLCALIQKIENLEDVKSNLTYFPNSSSYMVKDRFRYIEFKYKGIRRKHYLAEIESDEVLMTIVEKAKNGIKLKELISYLISEDYDKEDAFEYANALISNQILISELDPGVTGNDLLTTLIEKLSKIVPEFNLIPILKTIHEKLIQLDSLPIGRPLHLYTAIEEDIKTLNVGYEKKYLFQTDLKIHSNVQARLSEDVVQQTLEGIAVLNKLTLPSSGALNTFKEKFYSRYEEEEVPLCEVLDSDIGISFFNATPGSGEIHPLIDDIPQASPAAASSGQVVNEIDNFLYDKYVAAIAKDSLEVEIFDEELSKFRENWNDLPTTFNCMAEILKIGENKENTIAIGSVGGSSAANLLARFCHLDTQLKTHVLNITAFEKESLEDHKILCEIVHLPESRTGNVLHRPVLRDFEISYLSNHSVENHCNIEVSDIMISIYRRSQLKIRSKKLNKEIIPRLSTAHNFSRNTLPIYQFLCMLQLEGCRGALSFRWGNLLTKKGFYPRVKYKNVILSVAKWHLDSKALLLADEGKDKVEELRKIKERFKLPNLINVVNGDNKMLIDLEDLDLINVLLLEAKKKTVIVVEEYLLDYENSLIKDGAAPYANQVIISYFKNPE